MQFNASYVSTGSHGSFGPGSTVVLRRVKTVYRREFESSNLIIPITRLKVMEVVGQGILLQIAKRYSEQRGIRWGVRKRVFFIRIEKQNN
jgi:hypothetical protein